MRGRPVDRQLELKLNDGGSRRLTPGAIALLAPVSTELCRYDRALEETGLPCFSAQFPSMLDFAILALVALSTSLAVHIDAFQKEVSSCSTGSRSL